MRIQHNIPAMNSYRNYSGNVSRVSKNLEKLSTGYKINRAGDDAAGLAISEKMRVQITGLEKAQSNAKSGINLVQTAEGALTEVHDMLNRMFDLAEQSANGTYDNTTDRNQLQKEVTQLKTEIDRIADSSNFNGIKLLDGSLEDGGTTGIEISGACTVGTAGGTTRGITYGDLTGGGTWAIGDKAKITLQATNGTSYTLELEVTDTAIVDKRSGTSYSLADATAGVTEDDMANALRGAIRDATGNAFELDTANTQIVSTATGSGAPAINAMVGEKISAANVSETLDFGLDASTITSAITASAKVGISGVTGVTKDMTLAEMKGKIFTINDQNFLLVTEDQDLSAVQKKVGDQVTLVTGADVTEAAGQIAKATGLILDAGNSVDGADITFLAGSGKGLTLQIGDTSESFNKLTVSIKDVHSASLGISGVNIGSQNGAAGALDVIKRAVNTVSDIRGGLGATQNRLDHTINNLSVMQENIQDAESTIRDVDVAKEMMAYTKNNILVQSAQAMLAQANQLPQGVLQLLG